MARKFNSLDLYYRAAVSHIREMLGNADVGGFHFTIKASGRTMTDRSEVQIVYKLGDSEWGANSVEGDTLENVLSEMLRRHGWNEAHKPLTLPAPDLPKAQRVTIDTSVDQD